ncbi:nitrile hydratase accessory protein [Celeribacter sp.]|uniref:nitrile hydratase accessory protein n=1 Tax=Celeribacter sp. TaxID=1890673 RepID=UPI003A94DAFD
MNLPEIMEHRAAFGKPWHASVFALVLALHEEGHFDWAEWVAAFAARRAEPDADGVGVEDGYYSAMQETLVALTEQAGALKSVEVAAVAEAWRGAYLATPHGQPIELSDECFAASLIDPVASAASRPAHDHEHHHHHHGHGHPKPEPLAVFPAVR